MMRTNNRPVAIALRVAALAMAVFGLSPSTVGAQPPVHLIAAPFMKAVTLPSGTSVTVPMWGYALDDGDGVLAPGEVVSSPGPRIIVPAGASSIVITLHNQLPAGTNTSLVIPGQAFTAKPAVNLDGRIVSMTPEVAPGFSETYTFGAKPGTFLYQSGWHQAVQVQMGLYGAVTKDLSAGNAYPDVAFTNEVVLLYSEIDRYLHQAVADGTYGTPAGPTSTLNYYPTLFLINGQSYANAAATPPLAAGVAGAPTLVRFLNAGLRTHAPVLDNGSLALVAEDGNKYPFARPQAAILLAAGKTHDALWTPTTAGDYSMYDRSLSLTAEGQGAAGMLVKLNISATAGGPSPTGLPVALNDAFATPEDTAIPAVPVSSVASNDTAATSYEIVTNPGAAAAFSFSPTGSFTYSPNPNFFGADSFLYRAVNVNGSSIATAIITVIAVPDNPVAVAQAIEVQATKSVTTTLGGTDADGDELTFYLTDLPDHGSLSIVNPLDFTLVPIVAADLWPDTAATTPKVIPRGILIYTPSVTPSVYSGPDAFAFVAFDGVTASPASVVAVTVHPVAPADATLTQALALSVVGPDGNPIGGGYRWTLEEDRMYAVQPGVLDPNTLSVGFHASYMPVKRTGDETGIGGPCTDSSKLCVDPSKRYFVSVLPKNDGAGERYTNGGAPVAAGQSGVTVRVNSGPMPTAQIRVRVFQDNSPLNGAWDQDEVGLNGFAVTIEDAGGRYGMSAAQQLMDAFGNPIGTTYQPCSEACESYEVLSYGKGYVLTDTVNGEPGWALIENLAPGKYGVKIIVPGGSSWQQTATIEGTRVVDAWVKANEPTYFAEFGPPGPHADMGFTVATNTFGAGGRTLTGQVTNLHHSRPPNFQMFSGAPFDFTRPWVALNTGAVGGTLVYAQPTDDDGNFTISGVPNGTYQLVIFDSALNIIIANKVINVTQNMALEEIPVQQWFTRVYNYVFEDTNGDGRRQSDEAGIPEQAINIRFRDGSMYQSMPTDLTGFVPFEQVFPFFSWLVAEVDFTRFRATGATVVVDAGGDPTLIANTGWPAAVGAELDPAVLVPQPQSENGNAAFRTETGPVLLEAFQGFIGQSSVMLWGKAPYAPVSPTSDVNVYPFDDFPGPGDTDQDNLGAFDGDQFNGGISGIVHYSITRAENDPRWGGAEVWEPGIADVTVQLWDVTRTKLLNEVTTDSWDASQPTGCQGPVFSFLGQDKDCFDGLRNFNQVRPGVFDGGYAFLSILEPTAASPTPASWLTPIANRGAGYREVPIPAGKYVVRVVPPPGYKIVKEEDKNVDFGDEYIPQEFYLTGYPLGAGGAGEAPPKAGVAYEPLAVPFCVGAQHVVPGELSLYPGVPGAYAGDLRPLCDEKLVTLRGGQNPGSNFFLFTEAPIAGHIVGFVLDDTANEFDPNSPQFGEKYAPPFMPVSIRDWTGREITSTHTDAYGRYNVLVPSTFTANEPIPSGMAPSMLTVCINSPTTVTPAGLTVPNPDHYRQYSHFCYTFNFMPGTTTYLDTPVLPTGAFTSNAGKFPVDAELPSGTPVIAKVTNVASLTTTPVEGTANQIGPYIVDRTASGNVNNLPLTRTIEITSAGMMTVPNPAYDGLEGTQPKTILRDYTFGTDVARIVVRLGVSAIPAGNVTLTAGVLRVVIPRGAATDQLTVERCLSTSTSPCTDWRKSTLGVTLTVAAASVHDTQVAGVFVRRPIVKLPTQTIQQAIDAAPTGALVLVPPGTYEEAVVMRKPVRLQGWGALATVINTVAAPAEKLQAWRQDVSGVLSDNTAFLTEQQLTILGAPPFALEGMAAALGGEAPGVMVLGRPLAITNAAGNGRCLQNGQTNSTAQTTFTISLNNEAYCLQNEGSVLTTPTVAVVVPRANARIDGLSLIGAMNGSGIMVNAHARYLDIGNNRITNNMGDFAGGIKVGLTGIPVPPPEPDGPTLTDSALNTAVVIHNNLVGQNGSLAMAGGGGIVIGSGTNNYQVKDNFVAANFTAGQGAGISHIGRSPGGVIDRNWIVFNEGFNQGIGRNGGGLFIGGAPPLVAGGSTEGSGSVRVTNNLIQGNFIASGDGGGVALEGVNATAGIDNGASDRSKVALYNNIIVNNAAGLAGGGVSLHDASYVEIIHNTIVRNDSLATAGGAFFDPDQSEPQPAGIVSRGNSYGSLNGSTFSNPTIINSIVRENRSFYFGPLPGGVQNPGDPVPPLVTYGLIVSPAGSGNPNGTGGRTSCTINSVAYRCWDFGVLGNTGVFAPSNTVVTATNTVNGSGNSQAAPSFVASYINAGPGPYIESPEQTSILAPLAFDEGGTFVRPIFGPLSLQNPAGLALFGNYHVTAGVTGASIPLTGLPVNVNRSALLFDIDAQARPSAGGPPPTSITTAAHRGADQKTADAAPGSGTPLAPVITGQPASQTIAPGGTAALSVTATGTGLSYQWYQGVGLDAIPAPALPPASATLSTYTTPPLTVVTVYWVAVSNAFGVAVSNIATITPVASVEPVAIATHPANQAILSGATATLSVGATGTPPLTYQWYQGASGNTTTEAPGISTDFSYTTPALTATTSYWVRVTNVAGFADSTTATVTVVPPPVSVYFSTSGNTNPPGVGGTSDDADIYLWNGSVFSRAIDVTTITNPLPTTANVDGFQRVDATHFYMSFSGDTTISLPGPDLTVQDEDIVYYNAGTWSVYFDGTAAGLADPNEDIDAFLIVGSNILFSTSGNTNPPGVGGTADDADIYLWNGSVFSRAIDVTTITNPLPTTANVDGFHGVDATHFYMSFSGDTTISLPGPDLTVQDEDIVYYNAGTWSVYFDGTAAGLTSGDLDIDAFSVP